MVKIYKKNTKQWKWCVLCNDPICISCRLWYIGITVCQLHPYRWWIGSRQTYLEDIRLVLQFTLSELTKCPRGQTNPPVKWMQICKVSSSFSNENSLSGHYVIRSCSYSTIQNPWPIQKNKLPSIQHGIPHCWYMTISRQSYFHNGIRKPVRYYIYME